MFYTKFAFYLTKIYHDELEFVHFLSQFMISSALITFFSFTFLDIRAMYGRYSSESFFANISIPAKFAWFLQELPSLLIPLFVIWHRGLYNIPFENSIALAISLIYPWLIRGGKPTPIHLFLLGFIFATWNGYIQGCFHVKYANYGKGYFWTFGSLFVIFRHRGLYNIPFENSIALAISLIYPWLIRGGKPTPIHLFLLGFIFATWNGYIQGCFHVKYANYGKGYFWTFGSLFGTFLFLSGMFINLRADFILRALRRPGEKCYKIPHGGMFKYVSCANFLGEIIEWIGYAIYAQSTASLAFALFTAANTIPRAKLHHKWYLNKFGNNYPQDRKAVIPFIY
uniref:Steroid 5-alpha reductase C-terminal domain-containing protein n=1 Tax=Meloidogyne incognita TaxID=6306 RepID=A0A914LTI3_MELIC